MTKIVYVPVDERPCNYDFPQEIFKDTDIDLVVPSKSVMPHKKAPADNAMLNDFLLSETKDAYGLVISMDTLLYGGLVPSRIHSLNEETLKTRLQTIQALKHENPDLKIFAFQLIMRCPQHNSADEEPPYYKTCGRQIYLHGYFEHRKRLGLITDTQLQELDELHLDDNDLADFLSRRQMNLKYDLLSLELTENKLIDFIIFLPGRCWRVRVSRYGSGDYPTRNQNKETDYESIRILRSR